MLKAEGGYSLFNDASLLDPAAGEARAEGVAGLEYTLFGVKSIGEFVLDWEKGPAGSGDSWTKTLVLILNSEQGSRLSLKAFGGWNLDGSGMLSPQVAYTLADGLEASGKAFVFFGGDGTKYGAWRDNALFQASLTYSF